MNALFAISLVVATLSADRLHHLHEAESHFREGVANRNDAEIARGHFARAAAEYDALWRIGARTAAVAKNRAHAHRLAGNLAASIAALHDGLEIARFDRSLQQELEGTRSAVRYPSEDLADECRSQPSRGIGTRMSPAEAYLIAAALWFGVFLSAARFAMTRVPGWMFASAACLLGLAILGGFWWQDARQQTRALVIVSREHALKVGNGELWPDRVKGMLPPGTETRELSRRGGWIQVELASGAAGWIPESHAMEVP